MEKEQWHPESHTKIWLLNACLGLSPASLLSCYNFPGISGSFPFPEFLSTDRNWEHSLSRWRINQREDTHRIRWLAIPVLHQKSDLISGTRMLGPLPQSYGLSAQDTIQLLAPDLEVSSQSAAPPSFMPCPRVTETGNRGLRETTFFTECRSQRKFFTTNAETRVEALEERSLCP